MNEYQQCVRCVLFDLEQKAESDSRSCSIRVDDLDCIPREVKGWILKEVRSSVTKRTLAGCELVADYERVR
jgi:hypothetical protein